MRNVLCDYFKSYLIRSEGFFLGKNDILTESQKSEILVEMFIVSSSEKLWALERTELKG